MEQITDYAASLGMKNFIHQIPVLYNSKLLKGKVNFSLFFLEQKNNLRNIKKVYVGN
jgi:hypothetical protein